MAEAFESPRRELTSVPKPQRHILLGDAVAGSQLVPPMEAVPPAPPARERQEGRVSIDEAREILGEQMVKGPESIQRVFGIQLEVGDIPPIPFDRARLEQAARHQMRLVLRIDHDGQGKPLTIENMRALRRASGGGELIEGWYPGLPLYQDGFFREERPEMRWVLVGRYLAMGPGSADPFQHAEAQLSRKGKQTADTQKRITQIKAQSYGDVTRGSSERTRAWRESLETLYREFPEASPPRSASEVVYDAALFGSSSAAYQGFKTAENNPTTGAGFYTSTRGQGFIHVHDDGRGQVKLTDLTGQGIPYQTGAVEVDTK